MTFRETPPNPLSLCNIDIKVICVIFRPKLLHPQFHLISTVLVISRFRSLTTWYKNIRTQMDYIYVCFAITAKLMKVWIEELLCCVQVVWFPCVSAPLTNSHYKLDPTIPIQWMAGYFPLVVVLYIALWIVFTKVVVGVVLNVVTDIWKVFFIYDNRLLL